MPTQGSEPCAAALSVREVGDMAASGRASVVVIRIEK